MEQTILTVKEKDLTNYLKMVAEMRSDIAELKQIFSNKPSKIINSREIKTRLALHNPKAFDRRINELMDAGMFKDGQWKMRERDLEKYINAKMSE